MDICMMQVFNMSCQAGIIICIILIVRQIFHWIKVPKKFSYCLWLIPFFRMICPWTVESIFSLMPIKFINRGIQQVLNLTAAGEDDTVWQAVQYMQTIAPLFGNQGLAGTTPTTIVHATSAGSDTARFWMTLMGIIWLTGSCLFLFYCMVSYWRLKRKLTCSICMEDNIYLADYIDTPFVLGVWKPRIYLPSDLQSREMPYVIAHEQVHIRRKDYLIKILAFMIVSIHWFNPLAWIAFFYMGKDMELSCDEMVLKQFGMDCRNEYASVLLELTTGKKQLFGTPLAFGEGDTKGRVHNIMEYKKPVMIVVIFAVLALIALAVGLLTLPKSDGDLPGANPGVLTKDSNHSEQNSETSEEELHNTEEEWRTKEEVESESEEAMLNSSTYALSIRQETLTASGADIVIYNQSKEEILCGEYFYIDSWEGEEWKPVSCKDGVEFKDIGYSIMAEGTLEKSIDWNTLYGELEPGIYLLRVPISVPNDEGGYETVELGTHFSLN